MTRIFLWLIYFPIVFTLRCLLFWIPPITNRIRFEKRNRRDRGSRSFKECSEVADLCFEFASEGEYQQVASLVEDALKQGSKVELVFSSPSVEKTICDLYAKYPGQIRYFRYAIATFGPWRSFTKWSTSKNLILVRYDFFPEFLLWSKGKGRKLKIVWMTFKKERSNGKNPSFYKKLFLKASSFTVFATEEDLAMAQKFGINGEVYDFRLEQIRRRCEVREEKFDSHFPEYGFLKVMMNKYPRDRRIIIGNAWPADIDVLSELYRDEALLVIVPHKLDGAIFREMEKKLEKMGRKPLIVSDTWPGTGSTYILNKRGILCELYGDFGKAYVGGGFGVSVHSLLEPLVSGSELICCGPIHYRSTEFDLARSLGDMQEVSGSNDFATWSRLGLPTTSTRDKMKGVFERYPKLMRDVLVC